MEAIVINKYGSPENLHLEEVDTPAPAENEVLVKIEATTINDYDWSIALGRPYLYRLLFGITKPKNPIAGMELSGTIESLGKNASYFEVGDRVYGDISHHGFGTFAQYVCINEKALVHQPNGMSDVDAAALPHASCLAIQGLIEVGEIKDDSRILINGAGGGVGTIGLQIAKVYGAEVTGVDSGDKFGSMKSIGFDHVIDYKKDDFTKNGIQYDLILDAKSTRSPRAYLRALKPKGSYVTVRGFLPSLIGIALFKPLNSKISGKQLKIANLKPNKNLDFVGKLYAEGRLRPVIDGPYPLFEIPRMVQSFGEGKHKGKIVISVSH